MSPRPGVETVTLGCRLNALESEQIRTQAARLGVTGTVVVNSCAVTAEAVRQSRQTIRRLRRLHPQHRILATGCATETDPEGFRAMPELDGLLANRTKASPETWSRLAPGPAAAGAAHPGVRSSPPRRARAYVEVQNGCDHSCTFCIIPQGRGESRSVPLAEIIHQSRARCREGYRELVLTGVDLTAWGGDLAEPLGLGELVGRLLSAVPELPRLRISSIDAAEVDPVLESLLVSEPRLMPQVHLSLQAGDDLILKRMKRRHRRDDAIRFCARLRAGRDIAIGADLIAGFPTETEAMFERSLELVEECRLDYLHVFPFSPRPGTPAARMPQLPREVVRARASRLREAGARRRQRRLARLVGSTLSTLVETPLRGRSECHAEVAFRHPRPAGEIGEIVAAPITDLADGRLQAA